MPLANYSFDAIGTRWSIETDTALTAAERRDITQIIEQFDRAYSRFRTDSRVSQLKKERVANFPESIVELFSVYKKLNVVSNGAINPLVGTSLEALGYDAEYSLQVTKPTPAPIFSSIVLRDYTLTLQQPAVLDIGAIGKGYLVDQIAALLAKSHTEYVVDGSGDMAIHVATPQVIGLEHPFDSSKIIGTISLSSDSLCASAPNRRSWGKGLHHIIDATTGSPTTADIIATWAIAHDTVTADALTTGLFFVEPRVLQELFGDFLYVIMKKDGTVLHNVPPNIGELFTA